MCGIFGAVSLQGAPLKYSQCVAAMAAALAHRGPDGEQIVGHERARIGARRLAIMDLTTGDQPFRSPDGSVWMVCNGEIYNAPELRRECTQAGYPFRSTGDIETIVPLYERLGPDAVGRLDGMFGLALWDDRLRRLVLARDRAGEKPLFWSQIDGELRFASEIQALLVFPDQPRRVNPVAAELYAALGYVPAPHTLFAGISKLPPAHLLVADHAGVTLRRYWDAAAAAARSSRLDGPATLRTALLRAVERELMSDVPVGVFTSGGLDSSLLAAAAARVMAGERIHTYAVRFTEPGYDESPYAEAVTHHIRTSHHVVTADEAALERAFATVTRALAEPVGDPAILPTYLLAEAAREHVKVVLSGEGADELFGGYPTYLGHKAAGLYRRVPGRAVLRWLVNRLPTSTGKVTIEFMLKQLVAAAELPVVERHLTWFGALGPDPRAVAWANGLLDGFPTDPSVNRLLWLDFLSYLPDNLLVKVDRGTMLASIEARAPYLDRELLELVLPAPSGLKVRGLATKAILKEAARGLVRDDVIRRRKRGLSVPVARWLNAGLATVADRYLAHPRLFPGAPTGRLLAEHRQGTRNHARKLWPILMAELWAERWNVDIAT
ncbi:MAG: asparagine synthase (glutamine-hydrolyzing) [Gemmatimonadetes bacterium 13_1_40CM_3_69_22]|nr:MAG: asparagine synthase (glutamine-hydrolyzing) [Gemmatimonadetes bacterium 13_2_20CM_69_8]OLD00909.1 MAG: asparagine synthase (glutamine-hydrolyzing) [Gemmatimonadetes bacterium 13_1_40CM_3_69_22]OLD97182.1 MAG: asparagine synthase (glutamine-hydrolyzing) [Gemmatimonadetes bacterium 13_1_20CM_4_69_16]PYO14445.1 MAG: asparagine synthase (glutamine-hydrolyzing) [Gemmatimonadota bacterium]